MSKFLVQEGLQEDDVMQIDSDRKGSIKESEWKEVKQRLFNVDKHSKPKVIVSVLQVGRRLVVCTENLKLHT